MLLDEIEFEQQRFGVGIRDRDFHARRLRDQRLDLRLHVAGLKIRSDAAFEVARLADVENLAVRVQHPVHARAAGRLSTNALRRTRDGASARAARPVRSRALPMTPSNMAVVSRRVCVL